MIYDKIENIKNCNLPKCVVDFLGRLNSDLPLGRINLSEDCFVNVEEYYTKSHDNCYLENHRKYMDIQIVLSGIERLDFTDTVDLLVKEEYDEKRDIEFFYVPQNPINTVVLKDGVCAIIHPSEAHMPQMNYLNESCKIKKAVIKIKVD